MNAPPFICYKEAHRVCFIASSSHFLLDAFLINIASTFIPGNPSLLWDCLQL